MSDYLTEKQEALLNFIEDYQLNFGKSPTIKEMKEHFQVNSDNSILKPLKVLTEKGYIQKDDTPRGIQLLESVRSRLHDTSTVSLPLLGFIPAGGPVLTEQYVDRWVKLGDDMVSAKDSKNFFLLQVRGNSMIDAGIFEGDTVLVDTAKTPKNGDVVVALIDNANTLKRFIKEGAHVYLRAENKEYPDIHPLNELIIQGVVKSLIRQF